MILFLDYFIQLYDFCILNTQIHFNYETFYSTLRSITSVLIFY